MANLQVRFFWLLVLVAQIAILAAPFTAFYQQLGLQPPYLFTTLFQLAYCFPLILLVLQKPALRKNFWAGFFGISIASFILSAANLIRLLFQSYTEHALGFIAFVAIIQITCIFAQFIYIYSSPQIWQRA